ncbi:MAG: hypothetical protein HY646_07165 [Acidobacteria bacterium]|nr:hypothetical protein [Acidobacteriota bacterium]
MKSVYIVDALNYIHRSFHAIPPSVTSPKGVLTNAVLGYLRTLLRIIKEAKPEYMAVAFEGHASFRSSIFAEYKATRKQPPEALTRQFDYCRKITRAIGVSCFELDGYEADDIIGTIATRMSTLGYRVVIVTGDKDMSQLVRDNVYVYDFANQAWIDESGVREKFGVAPAQIPDLLALHGDHVDNIPGVMGIGEKTARHILSVCTSVEQLIESPELGSHMTFRGRDEILRRIRENIETVRMSRKLATICCDAPLEVTPDRVRYRRGDKHILDPLCHELGFSQVLPDIPLAQPTLFS